VALNSPNALVNGPFTDSLDLSDGIVNSSRVREQSRPCHAHC